MSNGQEAASQYAGQFDYLALDEQETDSNGAWFNTSAVIHYTLTVNQMEANAHIKVHGSNAINKPDNAVDGIQLADYTKAAPVSAEDLVFSGSVPYRFMKVSKDADATPVPSTVVFHGVAR